jgi:hypothetical protein
MSLELLNTLASVTTMLVIGTASIAALIQLRHLRAGNQIQGQLAIRQVLLDAQFRESLRRLRRDFPSLIAEPSFRTFLATGTARGTDVPADYVELREAALGVGQNLENIGNMIRNGLTDRRIFLEQYGPIVVDAWAVLEPHARIQREAAHSDAPWEDFEYLTVLSRQWMAQCGTCYPKDVPRILPPYSQH